MNPLASWFSGGGGRIFGRLLRLCLAGLLVSGTERLWAQPAPDQPPALSNRYLLIVETSQAMKARKRGMLQAVQELLKSGMGGQIRAGDTLGVWTYNTNLYTGRLPLQRWSPADQKAINARLVSFLKDQKFEKAAELGRILPAVERVVKDSHLITVILVCAGDEVIRGTPFDDWINEFCQQQREKQKTAKMPLVIVLRAKDGEVVDYTLNQPPWPVQMPYSPPETQVAAAPPQKGIPAAPVKDKTPTAPPLIVSGKKPAPLEAPKSEEAKVWRRKPPAPAGEAGSKASTPTSPATAGKVEPPPPVPAATTNPSPPPKPDEPKPATAAKVAPMLETPPKLAPEASPTTIPAAVEPAAPPPPEAPKPETAKAAEPKLAQAIPAPASKPKPEAIPAPLPPPLPPPSAAALPGTQVTSAPPPPSPRPAAAVSAPAARETAATPTKASPAPEKNAEPTVLPGPVREVVSAPSMTVTNAASAPGATSSTSLGSREPATARAQTAVTDPAASFLSQKTTWIAGLLLLGAAFGFSWMALRRSRATPHASLITRSLDRQSKP